MLGHGPGLLGQGTGAMSGPAAVEQRPGKADADRGKALVAQRLVFEKRITRARGKLGFGPGSFRLCLTIERGGPRAQCLELRARRQRRRREGTDIRDHRRRGYPGHHLVQRHPASQVPAQAAVVGGAGDIQRILRF